MKLRFILSAMIISLLALSACSKPAVEESDEVSVGSEVDLAPVKDYTLRNAQQMKGNTQLLAANAKAYFELIEKNNFDYGAAFSASMDEMIDLTEDLKKNWIDASTYYEFTEGIVAGVPSLADFDVWLDAGPSGEEDPVEARVWNLELKDGRTLENPGNFFHSLLEPAIWGTKEEFVALKTGYDGGQVPAVDFIFPDAYLLLAAAEGLDNAGGEMIAAVQDWDANLEDVFTALVTMIPTMNEYFGQWEASFFIAGNESKEQAFVGVSRLADIKGILNGLDVAYKNVSKLVEAKDPLLNQQILTGFFQLITYVDGIYLQEKNGKVFTAEQATQFGAEAQSMADSLTGQVAQAAALLGLKIN